MTLMSAAKTLVERLYSNGATRGVCGARHFHTSDQVRDVISFADGAIVGSALVRALAHGGVDSSRHAGGLSSTRAPHALLRDPERHK
jgi:tryptophan synthase alpha chain